MDYENFKKDYDKYMNWSNPDVFKLDSMFMHEPLKGGASPDIFHSVITRSPMQ